jgi:hypothetical protein
MAMYFLEKISFRLEWLSNIVGFNNGDAAASGSIRPSGVGGWLGPPCLCVPRTRLGHRRSHCTKGLLADLAKPVKIWENVIRQECYN